MAVLIPAGFPSCPISTRSRKQDRLRHLISFHCSSGRRVQRDAADGLALPHLSFKSSYLRAVSHTP